MRPRSLLIPTGVVALGAAAVAVAGTWQSPATLTTAGQTAAQARVAAGANGVAVAAWRVGSGANTQVYSARYGGRSWFGNRIVSTMGSIVDPAIAVDATGNATALWSRSNGAHYELQWSRAASGSIAPWSAPQVLSAAGTGANALRAQAVADSGGVVTAVWKRWDGSNYIIQAARYAGGAWGAPVDLSASGQDADIPQLAVDPDGTVTVVWTRSDGTNTLVQAVRHTGSGWGPIATLSAAGENGEAPRVAVGADGVPVAVWYRVVSANYAVQASRYVGGAWSAPADVTSAGPPAATRPAVAVGGDGVPTVVWQRSDGTNTIIQASRYSDGAWGAAANLSAPGQNALNAEVTADAGGAVTAVWQRSNGANAIIQSARYSGGAWGAPRDVSAEGANASTPQVSAGASRSVAAVWLRADGANTAAQGAVFDTEPSQPLSVTATPGDASATVSWSAPVADGGADITSYTATASPGGAQCTSTTTTCTLTGLANGVAHTVTVTAANAQGSSAASAPSAPFTPAGPAAAPSGGQEASARQSTPRTLAGRFVLRGRSGTTTGALQADVTRVAQLATGSAGATRRGRCVVVTVRNRSKKRVTKRSYRCTITLGKGSWTVVTTGQGTTGVVAQGTRAVRVKR